MRRVRLSFEPLDEDATDAAMFRALEGIGTEALGVGQDLAEAFLEDQRMLERVRRHMRRRRAGGGGHHDGGR